MGKRGPAPKPDNVRVLEGGGKAKANAEGTVAAVDAPEKPSDLAGEAAAEWDRVVDSLPPQLLARVDRAMLTAWCQAWALHREASQKVNEEGAIAYGKEGQPYQNPWVSILNKQAQLMTQIATRFGFSPSDRNALNINRDDAQSQDDTCQSKRDLIA